jgi:hypothetical protein
VANRALYRTRCGNHLLVIVATDDCFGFEAGFPPASASAK